MSLKLGCTIIIVVSSRELVKQILLEHDLSFSSRSVPYAARVVDHHLFSMVWLPVGDQWQRLRGMSKEHLFSSQQHDAGKLLRKNQIQKLVDYVHQCSISSKARNMGRAAFTTSHNILSNFIFSSDMAYYESLVSQECKDAVSASVYIAGKSNLADFFPLLKPFDPQALLRKGSAYAEKLMAI